MRGDDMTNAARRNGIEVRSGHEQIARPGDDNRDRGMRPVQVFVEEVPDLTEDQLATQVERQREMETTTPAAEQRCRYQSWWQAESEATSSSSGFQRAGSPRNAGSDEPGIAGLAGAEISCSRP